MVVVNGSTDDWSPAQRLDEPGTGTPGFALYGTYEAETFHFAITSETAEIGQGTTLWLDTDLDRTTGYQIWGFTGGTEYHVEIAADGSAALYSGGPGGALVADLEYAYSADRRILELAVPRSLIAGGPESLRVFADVNNSVFLPNSYATMDFIVEASSSYVTHGTIALDGDLVDWEAETRLDNAATGTAGYALHGDVQDGHFLFGISADSVTVGAGTTIWLDTDLDRATGYQIFGFAGGAEYNIEVAADGSATLYSGGPGETFVADLDTFRSADGGVLELAVSRADLGGVASARIFADVNNAAYLPNDYANMDLFLGTVPTVTHGTVTLDGNLGDWAAGTRLDDATTGTAGYGLYGDIQNDHFLFAISADAVTVGAGSTIWLDTDLDRTTGYQIWGFAGGAEYNIEIAANGSAALYSGGPGQTFVADLETFRSADGHVLELAVARADLGGVASTRVFADVNNAAYLPSTYATMDLFVGAVPSVTHGSITLDGDLGDWEAGTRLDGATTGVAGYALYGDIQGDHFLFGISADAVTVGAGTTIWLDIDLDRTTGHQIFGFAGGVEYNIEIAADGSAALYSGGPGETFVADLDTFRSADGGVLELAVSRANLGGVASARIFADVNNSVYLPNDYSNVDFIVGAVPSVTHGTITLDGDLGDWAAGTRLDDAATGTPGHSFHGDIQNDHFLFGITSDAAIVGQGSTIWLDTDLDRTTGYQIWGFAGGAEYNIEIAADGSAALYSGGPGQTFVADLDTFRSADGHVLEVAVARADLGGVASARVFADVNNNAYLPNSYATMDFFVGDLPSVAYGTITLDGDLGDWAAGTRLDDAATGTAGYALYGDIQEGHFLFGVSADAVTVGAGSTIWLDTDLDRATGHQIFGFSGGAEYNIEIAADGSATLYSGGPGQTFVANLETFRSANGRVLELAVAAADLGGTTGTRVYADVNNNAYLPASYDAADYIVGGPTGTPQTPDDPGYRIGIVYSATSAANFYDETAYGQLVMSAQAQAMQAGIPFDLLSEADLMNAADLAGYDALVFPGFANVPAADLAAITAALTTASESYGVSLIAAGNFLTNDETGAAVSGDAYARMKTLLGVSITGSGTTDGIELTAGSGANPILAGYAPGETVGDYANTGYLAFGDVTGSGQVLFDQLVGPAGNKSTVAGVIATETAARNVHFASDAIIGNNNILHEAIDWVTQDDNPGVSLAMTRNDMLFFARNDMDQSQEIYEVIDRDPGIYDVMLPIVTDWYNDYGFTGSYYINLGANPPDQVTDWSASAPYYQALMALEGEIGSHSYTHPHDTNELEGDTAALLALIAQVDPRNPGHVDPWTLSASDRQMLEDSYRFQFETSRYEIEQALGIEVTGAAVPGAPERLQSTREMIRFYDYLSGGYSAEGAGYPNAFGYLTPGETERVYLAPNMSFDFTLIEFLGMTPTEAEAAWAQEHAQLTGHATTPILLFPWHDYGPTNFDLAGTYTEQMFESVIARAAADGAEFVTGDDLADRIASFAASEVTLGQSGNVITAQVTSSDAGTFALDVSESGTIASVGNWYAYDETKVFLPSAGGTFEITLGTPQAGVTRITELPMRADLLSVTGDGRDLSFDFTGRGDVQVALAAQGSDGVLIAGADGGAIGSGAVTLAFDAVATHAATVDFTAGGALVATAGSDIILGGSGADTITGGAGNDLMQGGGDADTFVFAPGFGIDRVLDFVSGTDLLDLTALAFQSAAEALAGFAETSEGLELAYSPQDSLLLAGLTLTQLEEDDLLAGPLLTV